MMLVWTNVNTVGANLSGFSLDSRSLIKFITTLRNEETKATDQIFLELTNSSASNMACLLMLLVLRF
ncbi:hypothetical protein SCA6_016517 [Theobroma cacao]